MLVCAYLAGRSMEDWMYQAVVWVAARRMAGGLTPVLDQWLQMDIDNQAQPAAVPCPGGGVNAVQPSATAPGLEGTPGP
jgi:hypothetical protein